MKYDVFTFNGDVFPSVNIAYFVLILMVNIVRDEKLQDGSKLVGYIVYRRFPPRREYLIYETVRRPHFWTIPIDNVTKYSNNFELALENLEAHIGLEEDDIIPVSFNGKKTFESGEGPVVDNLIILVAKLVAPDKKVAMHEQYMRFRWLPIEESIILANNISNLALNRTHEFLKLYNY